MTRERVAIAVIGGSGLYSLFADSAEARDSAEVDQNTDVHHNTATHDIATPYGPARVTIGDLAGTRVAFLPRHGADHSVAPHLINYRANIWALASLGVRAIVSSAAVGSVSAEFPPGTLAIPDQFIDRTHGRADTFYDRGSVQHLASADPFDPALLRIAADALADARPGAEVPVGATVVVIQGPRFSTRAESRWFAAAGGHLVNMTLYPEVPLASELGIGSVTLAFVTDTDADEKPAVPTTGDQASEELSAELVFARLRDAQPRIVEAITRIVAAIPADYRERELIAPDEIRAVLSRPIQPSTRASA